MPDSANSPLNDTEKSQLLANYQAVLDELAKCNEAAGRAQNGAALLAVSKTKPAAMLRALWQAGQVDFGENYLQEALAKQALLADLPIVWHYIGSIQRNKTKDIAAHFDWVHTLERGLIAKRLSEQRGEICRQNPSVPPLNVLIQLNIDDEASKSGVLPDELFALVDEVAQLPNLCLRGLMIIPDKAGSDAFVRTQALFDEVRARFDLPQWDTLSMGMSGDMAQAVAHGSTMVRIGTAIFGARDYA